MPADEAPRAEIAAKAAFDRVLYAQCWEDADILLEGLEVKPGDACLSVASAGDNSFALLTRDPARVLAVDLNPTQLSCVRLRAAAYRVLEHGPFLELMGSRPSTRRAALLARCRSLLDDPAERAFWEAREAEVERHGLGGIGRFEGYFRLFRRFVLPLIHGSATVAQLLAGSDRAAREAFWRDRWDGWRWRLLVRLFFSRFAMARLGREPAFFDHAKGSLSDQVMARARHAVTALDPADNPYLHWILTGRHGEALPVALRAANYDRIRANLDRLEIRLASVEEAAAGAERFDRYNLSDVFEYISEAGAQEVLARLAEQVRPGGRLLWWNMMVPRGVPPVLAGRLRPLDAEAARLHQAARAFFYSRLVLAEAA